MNCRSFQKQLPLLLDKDPQGEAVEELLAHASTCQNCAHELHEAREAMALLSPSRPLRASGRLKERTMEKILRLEAMEAASQAVGQVRFIHPAWHVYARFAVAAVLILFVIGLFSLRSGSRSGAAFALAIDGIIKARTVTYVITTHAPGSPDVRMENAYKEPGLLRSEGKKAGVVSIADMRTHKMILIMKNTKQYAESQLTSQSVLKINFIDSLRQLADEQGTPIGEKKIDGRPARGFRASRSGVRYDIWVDTTNNRIVRIDSTLENTPEVTSVISEIRYDQPLDDSLFSMTPPKDYSAMSVPELSRGEPNENDLINLLQFWAGHSPNQSFPDSLQPMELSKTSRKMRPDPKLSSQEQILKQTQKLTLGLMFTMRMTKENDWHYEGKGAKLGEANRPVCWWKPAGSQTYRIVYADLSIRDVSPSELPGKTAGQLK